MSQFRPCLNRKRLRLRLHSETSLCILNRLWPTFAVCVFVLSPPQRKRTGSSIIIVNDRSCTQPYFGIVWFMPARTTASPRNVGSQRPVTVKTTRDDLCRSPLQRIRVSKLSMSVVSSRGYQLVAYLNSISIPGISLNQILHDRRGFWCVFLFFVYILWFWKWWPRISDAFWL